MIFYYVKPMYIRIYILSFVNFPWLLNVLSHILCISYFQHYSSDIYMCTTENNIYWPSMCASCAWNLSSDWHCLRFVYWHCLRFIDWHCLGWVVLHCIWLVQLDLPPHVHFVSELRKNEIKIPYTIYINKIVNRW